MQFVMRPDQCYTTCMAKWSLISTTKLYELILPRYKGAKLIVRIFVKKLNLLSRVAE